MTMRHPAFGSFATPLVASGEAAALRTAVGDKTAELCARNYAGGLRAVVLTGSLARDEATWVHEATGWRLLGDAEFLLVFEPRAALPPQPALRSLSQEIQCALGREGILGYVQLAPVHPKYLRRLEPHIFAYELRSGGRVAWGDPAILSLITAFSPADIPLEDAWRLLANRMIEHMEAVAGVEVRRGSLPEGLRYRTVKLYLDMATSLLLFTGAYAPAYRERQRRLRILADAGTDENWPFPLGPFAHQVSVSTDLKLNGNWPDPLGARESRPPGVSTDVKPNGDWRENAALGWDFWRQGLQYARLLWHWELTRLAQGPPGATDRQLMRSWMRCQPFVHRLRGWMFVWRHCGWLRSWRWWPCWARLGAQGSPRYCVYSAAYSLFCRLPEVLEVGGDGTAPNALGEDVFRHLPVVQRPEGTKGSQCWADLVNEVAWNYHRFLEPTRA